MCFECQTLSWSYNSFFPFPLKTIILETRRRLEDEGQPVTNVAGCDITLNNSSPHCYSAAFGVSCLLEVKCQRRFLTLILFVFLNTIPYCWRLVKSSWHRAWVSAQQMLRVKSASGLFCTLWTVNYRMWERERASQSVRKTSPAGCPRSRIN